MAATFAVPENVREVLRFASIGIPERITSDNPCTLRLATTLTRPMYLKVIKTIEACGGRWDRQRGCHTFDRNPLEVLGLVQETRAAVNQQQAQQSFYTPPALAERMAALIDLRGLPADGRRDPTTGAGFRFLEPSCGEGALIRALHARYQQARITGFDTDPMALRRCGLTRVYPDPSAVRPPEWDGGYHVRDFLALHSPGRHDFDAVIMNPPFTKSQDALHVLHAMRFIHTQGVIVALMSPLALQKRTGAYGELRAAVTGPFRLTHEEVIPAKTFQDTDIETLLLRIERQ